MHASNASSDYSDIRHLPWFTSVRHLPYIYHSIDDVPIDKQRLFDWDSMASGEHFADDASCGSAWQISALECSIRRHAPVVFLQEQGAQIAFTLTQSHWAYHLKPLESHWQFGSSIHGDAAVPLLFDTVNTLQSLLSDRVLLVDVPGLTPGSLLRDIQAQAAWQEVRRNWTHASASLAGGTAGWLSRRSRNFRRSLNRGLRNAEKSEITFERHRPVTEASVREAFSRMISVEHLSWKGMQKAGLFQIPNFYRSLLQRYAERGQARVIFARSDGIDVGFCFGGRIGLTFRGQQTSFAESFRQFGIGQLMHFHMTQWLCSERVQHYHFGPIQDGIEYKSRFCEINPDSYSVRFTVR